MVAGDEEAPPPPEAPPAAPDAFEDLDTPSGPRSRRSRSGGNFIDFLLFRRMIAPWVIQALFWLGVLGCLGMGLFTMVIGLIGLASSRDAGTGILLLLLSLLQGLATMIVGPLLVRLYCELMIVIFRINETLTDISNKLDRRP
jgi:hypothetical protein